MINQVVLVATWDNGLFVITPTSRAQELTGQSVTGLASDGRNGALAIVDHHSLRRRSPSGEWSTLATSDLPLSCCMAVGETIYAGTGDACMLSLTPGSHALQAIESFNHIHGRNTWFAGSAIVNGQRLGPPLGIRSVSSNANGSLLFVNVHVGGIPRSTDGGLTWQPTIDINTDVHEVRAHPEQLNLVAAASAAGLCISHDGGTKWIIEHEGLHASHCSAVAFSGDHILISATTSQFAAEGQIYRRPISLHGALTAVLQVEGIADTNCIAANGSSVVVADRAGNLHTSLDHGHSWSSYRLSLPPPSGVLIC